jgi:tetratricopeptide (TPR) repeat protein
LARNPKVFCSHRSVDKARVREIAARLAAAGIDPWLDEWEIRAGDDIVQRINEGLASYDAGLIFFSSASLGSSWVSAEIDTLLYQRIQEGRCLIPVMIDRDAPLPPLLKPYARLAADQVDQLVDAIYGRSVKPAVAPPRAAVRERRFRLAVRSVDDGLGVRAELDGQAAGPEVTAPLGPAFAYSYQDFLRGRPAGSRAGLAAAAATAQDQLVRLGEALGAALFAEPVGASLSALLAEARRRNEDVLLSFETAEPGLLAIPFEAARLPGGVLPALEPGVRVVRRDTSAEASPLEPLPGPLRILVAVGAPDEERARTVVLDSERELQTILDAVEEAMRFGNAEVRILEVGHPGEIQKALLAQTFHVLYLSGHGAAGRLQLETEDGDPLPVRAGELADALRAARRPLPLVYLAACLTGAAESSETVSFAQGLLAAGIPQVLAMQTSVSDWYATRLAGAFFGHLARQEAPLASHALALARQEVEAARRKALASGRDAAGLAPEYATPSLFAAADERPLLDRGAPQEPLRLPPRPFVHGPVPLLGMDDLIGRRRELRELLGILRGDERAEARHGRRAGAVVTGLGGVGKSSLAGRAMTRLAEGGWHVVAAGGRLSLGDLATTVGAALAAGSGDGAGAGAAAEEIARVAARLKEPTLDDRERLHLLAALLGNQPVLLVLDNFEDNQETGTGALREPQLGAVLQALCEAAVRGRLLLTSRYPVPALEPWIVAVELGALSPAETRKLFLRLPALRGLGSEDRYLLVRTIGGHPRMLEYLDAILRHGAARLPDVGRRLRANAQKLGLRIEDLGADLTTALRDALRVGAKDILLDELLDVVGRTPGDREALEQAAVFAQPVEIAGVAHALAGAEPGPGRLAATRQAVERLLPTSLLGGLAAKRVWVHRWTAEALSDRADPAAWRERCRRAGEYLSWRVGNVSHAVGDGIESVRLFLRAEAFDRAFEEAWPILDFMERYGQTTEVAGFAQEVVLALPASHDDYPALLVTAADALSALGDTQGAIGRHCEAASLLEVRVKAAPDHAEHQRNLCSIYERLGNLNRALGQGATAQDFYQRALAIRERLAQVEPDRAEYQRELSVVYEGLGDLNLDLGQVAAAQELYRKDLAIAERLAQAEPDRADYQRDLSVSYSRLGDLNLDLGQVAAAQELHQRALAIRERLARSEPDRADYQRDLSVSYRKLGDLNLDLGELAAAEELYRKDLAITERLAQFEPGRADYQRDLSVSYNKLGDLKLNLGEVAAAQELYQRALAIAERLAQSEPDRADYQRDLSISYNKLGDLNRDQGQVVAAQGLYQRALAIRERLAQAEPERADYQSDLVASLSRIATTSPEQEAPALRRALAILTALQQVGSLLPRQEQHLLAIRQRLATLEPG